MLLSAFTFESSEELPPVDIPEDSRQYRALNNPFTPLIVDGLFDVATLDAIRHVFGFAEDEHFWSNLQIGLEVEQTGVLDWNTITELQRRCLVAPHGVFDVDTIKGVQAALNSGILF